MALRDALMHLRELYREKTTRTGEERLAQERREVFVNNLISNLSHLRQHPLLHVVSEGSQMFGLSLDGAHQLFGYELSQIREFDTRWNGGRTRIIESIPLLPDQRISLTHR